MATRAFITGINGFIGTHLAAYFRARGLEVSGLAHSPCQVPGARTLVGDIVHPAEYAQELSRCRIIVHLASPTLASVINANPVDALKVHWRGTANVLDCFRSGEGEHLVVLSSGKVYGKPESLPVSESQPLQPDTVLGKCKKAVEELVEFYAEQTDKRFTILRLFNAYGPGQKAGFLIPVILEQMLRGDTITLGDTRGKRDFIYIDDVISAIGAVLFDANGLELPRVSGAPRVSVFNVGSGESHSPADIVRFLSEISARSLEVKVDPARLRAGEPDEERADITRLSSLGWRPAFDLSKGLKMTWEGARGAG